MLSLFRNYIAHLPGWKTNRKLVIIESDDWGSIRIPSREAFTRLVEKGVDMKSGDSLRYNLYDTLGNESDFSALFETLRNHRDVNGKHPVITAMSLTANPDFKKIKDHKFQSYFYENVTTTLKRYYPNQDVMACWRQGTTDQLFVPQFHGREHLNVPVWMHALQRGDLDTLSAFEEECWGFTNKHPLHIYYQSAFELASPSEIEYHKEVLATGLDLFESIHGYKAIFFVPPNGPINNALEATARENGIEFISGSKIQRESLGEGRVRTRFHYMGQRSKYGLRYMTRNCFFEPSQHGRAWVNSCLAEVETAFRFKNPAVISSHRVNYIGAIDEQNRKDGLRALDELLKGILIRWPQVEFMTSQDLGKLIRNE